MQCLGAALDSSCVLTHLILTTVADCIPKHFCSNTSLPTCSFYNSSDTLLMESQGLCHPHLNLGLGTNGWSDTTRLPRPGHQR